MTLAASLLAAVLVGTWNGNWFPSGRAEHRAPEEVEEATVRAAGKMLRAGIDALDPAGTNDLVICLNEIRGPRRARELCAAIGRTNLTLAVITGYRRRDRFDQQQDAILTTLPVAASNWSLWKRGGKTLVPPRGYACAKVVVSPAVTATVYAVHLKSDYGATTDEIRKSNREKRRLPVEQLVSMEKPNRRQASSPVVIAGDFNTDRWPKKSEPESIFKTLEDAGFVNTSALMPEGARGTHPSAKWGDSALDYVFVRGMAPIGAPVVTSAQKLSDHKPLFVLLGN